MNRLLIFISLFFSLTTSAQNFAVKSFRSLPQDMDARINHPIIDQNGEKSALIKIVTSEHAFEFEGGMLGIVKTEQKTGEIWVYVPRAAKKITIKHANLGVLRNYLYPESIKEASVYEMVLVSGKVRTLVEPLEIAAQWLVIQTEPSGATFYLNEKKIGETPLNRKYKEGIYDYRIEYPRYHPIIGKLEIKDKKVEINHVLKPKFGDIYVRSEPEDGMKIFVNEKDTKKSTPALLTGIDSGNQEIGLKSKWYLNQTKQISVKDEVQTDVSFIMEPAFANVIIKTNEDAEIFINGEKYGTESWSGRLLEGIYEVNIEKANYQTQNKQLDIQAGKDISLNFNLIAQTGNIDIQSKPIGAKILINGKAYGTTPNTITDLICGKHELQLSYAEYATHYQTIEILENKTTQIDTILSDASRVLIESSPNGANVMINNKLAGKTPLYTQLAYGKHELLIINGEIQKQGTINVRMNEENTFFADVRSDADKQEIMIWEKAEQTEKIQHYQNYLNTYPKGKYADEAERAIRRIKINKDNAMYEKAISTNSLADYEIYLDSFPKGIHIEPIHEVLENSYYVLGNEAYDENNYSLTQFYFNKYISTYPVTERSKEVMKKLNKANNRLNRKDNAFLMYSYDTESEIGLAAGRLKQKGMGTYYAIKCNFHWITTGSQIQHTKAEYERLFFNAQYQNKSRSGNLAFSLGITYPLFYPVWAYGGVGFGHYPHYELYRNDFGDDEWVRNETISNERYFYEGGIMINISTNYAIKYGMLLNEKLVHQFGVAIRF